MYKNVKSAAVQDHINIKLETKAMPLLRHCNTGRTCFPLPITTTEKNLPSYTRCSENHNNMCAENWKIRGLKFDIP